MKITLNWLKNYVDFDWSPEELAERLTMLGIEVEGVEKLGGEFDGVVVAQVLSSEKHPNADKLSVCRVADGKGERQIVCGAKNYAVGDKVPLILPDHTLPTRPGEQPMTIKAGKLRGVESQGMLCSPKELGLAEDAQGLMILPADAKVGQPFAEFLGRVGGDVVYDLEITPNRPDLNSVIGIAREVSAVTGNPLRIPDPAKALVGARMAADSAESMVGVRLEDADLCPRYLARLVRGVKIGPSPDWLRSALEKVGIRSINNVVDVTNYVMLEVGQPLHAFDYHLLTPKAGETRPSIVVRRALDGERFVTLDGQTRTLTNQMLLIADETKAVALAGVMGGLNSEINPDTVDVLVEAAYFKPQNVRATSKRLDLRSDASYRFERGADPGGTDWASQRAVQLILETAGGELSPGAVDACPKPAQPAEITLRHVKASELLGVEVPVQTQIDYLQRLELKLGGAEHGAFNTFRVPTFRVDLKREVDLIEEIARLYGVDRIPSTSPRGAIGAHPYDTVHDELADARRILTGLGLMEAQGQTLVTSNAVLPQSEGEALVPLANPLSSDMNVLRPSLLPGLLDALRHNTHHRNPNVALFEIGRVFGAKGGATLEHRRLAIALTGERNPSFWTGDDRHAKYDSYDLKGLLEEFLEQFGLRGLTWVQQAGSAPFYLESATVQLGRNAIGTVGQLLPSLAKQYDLREAVLLAELDLDQLLARRNTARSFKPLPQFPSIQRDVAMILPDRTTHDAVLNVVKQAKPKNLEAVELFDVFRGKNVPAGQKSMAYSFTYRAADRTLTDSEVNAAHEKLVEQLKQLLQAAVRE
ncbi:MAG: phenylalanine--tRNA ligase subunit beta [Verrucomicrobiia bacterium]